MTNQLRSFMRLTNDELLLEVKALAGHERVATAQLIASLAELDARRLYLGEGFSSMFTYCTQALHLSEHAAYGRIEAARVARKWPIVLEMLNDGSITLTTLGLLSSHLTPENHQAVLDAAKHRSKREVEDQVARLRPLPHVTASVRKLPAPKALAGEQVTAPQPESLIPLEPARIGPARHDAAPVTPALSLTRAVVAPLAPERYKLQLTMTKETHDKLRSVQDLMRHSLPDGDPAVILDRALTLLLEDLQRTKLAAAARPRSAHESNPRARHVPATVKREVWQRDGGQCAFVGTSGRCTERGFLEFHHVVPFAEGGETTSGNLQLRCRAHNAYEAQQHFGAMFLRDAHERNQLGPDREHAP